jgi:hypothetical protein
MKRRFIPGAADGIAVAFLWPAAPASADSFLFGYSSGHRQDNHRRHHHHQQHHWPRYHYSYYHYPPPVYYVPAPRVIYVPAAAALAAIPTPPHRTVDGRYCREYQATVTVDGMPQPRSGTACLQPDGSWRVVN